MLTTYITISDYLSQGGVMEEGQRVYSTPIGQLIGTFKTMSSQNDGLFFINQSECPCEVVGFWVSIPVIPAFKIEQLLGKYENNISKIKHLNTDDSYTDIICTLNDVSKDLKQLTQ